MAEFSLIMLATTPEGDAYTFKEYEQMFGRVGFSARSCIRFLVRSNRCLCPTNSLEAQPLTEEGSGLFTTPSSRSQL